MYKIQNHPFNIIKYNQVDKVCIFPLIVGSSIGANGAESNDLQTILHFTPFTAFLPWPDPCTLTQEIQISNILSAIFTFLSCHNPLPFLSSHTPIHSPTQRPALTNHSHFFQLHWLPFLVSLTFIHSFMRIFIPMLFELIQFIYCLYKQKHQCISFVRSFSHDIHAWEEKIKKTEQLNRTNHGDDTFLIPPLALFCQPMFSSNSVPLNPFHNDSGYSFRISISDQWGVTQMVCSTYCPYVTSPRPCMVPSLNVLTSAVPWHPSFSRYCMSIRYATTLSVIVYSFVQSILCSWWHNYA